MLKSNCADAELGDVGLSIGQGGGGGVEYTLSKNACKALSKNACKTLSKMTSR